MWKRLLVLTLSVCLWAPGIAAEDPANVQDLLDIQQRLQRVLTRAKEATVAVGYTGSGVIVSEDGYVLSAEHVTRRPGRSMTLTLDDGRKVKAETLGASRFADAGLLKITEAGEWPFVPLAPEAGTRVGDWCFALGHPGGYDESRGLVVRIGRVIAIRRNMMRTDCQLIGGDSGGPLLNLKGEVIGINSRVSEDIDGNYHAPVEAVHRHWDMLVEARIVPPRSGRGGGFLGVVIDAHEEGVVIERFVEDSAAEEALLKAGDIITHVGDYEVLSPEELSLTIGSLKPEEEVTIRFRREESEQTVKVKLGSRPPRDSPR